MPFLDASALALTLNPYFLAISTIFYFTIATAVFIMLAYPSFVPRRRRTYTPRMRSPIEVMVDETQAQALATTQLHPRFQERPVAQGADLPPWPTTSEDTAEFNVAVRRAFREIEETIRQVDTMVQARIADIHDIVGAVGAANAKEALESRSKLRRDEGPLQKKEWQHQCLGIVDEYAHS